MNTLDVLMKRRSIRLFRDKQVRREDLEAIAQAGRFAPTARNVQPWKFVAITDRKVLEAIGRLAENGRFIASCAACLAVFCEDTKYYLEDGCAATVNMLNAAAFLGIGSCWVAGDKKPYCREISDLLNAPENLRLVSLVVLGYPQGEDALRLADKKPLEEILRWERF